MSSHYLKKNIDHRQRHLENGFAALAYINRKNKENRRWCGSEEEAMTKIDLSTLFLYGYLYVE